MTGTRLRGEVRTVAEVLAGARTAVDPTLRAAVDSLPGSTRRVVGYHFGWWDRYGDSTVGGAHGKAIRPALVLLAARATRPGAETERSAIAAAAAVELVHNSSLLHDDVIDDDRTRRHRPTAWTVFGIGDAIMAGDALLILATDLLSTAEPRVPSPARPSPDATRPSPPETRRPAPPEVAGSPPLETSWTAPAEVAGPAPPETPWPVSSEVARAAAPEALWAAPSEVAGAAVRMLGEAVQRLLHGQCADLALEARPDADLEACTEMALGKTGALMGSACALGCLVAGGPPERVAHFQRAGERLGLAFQHVDDLLGIWGDPAVTGKPIHSDLRNRKKSLPVVYALTSGTAAGGELAALLGKRGDLTPEELAQAAHLVEEAGGRTWSDEQATRLLTSALRDIRHADPDPAAEAELASLAQLISRRDR